MAVSWLVDKMALEKWHWFRHMHSAVYTRLPSYRMQDPENKDLLIVDSCLLEEITVVLTNCGLWWKMLRNAGMDKAQTELWARLPGRCCPLEADVPCTISTWNALDLGCCQLLVSLPKSRHCWAWQWVFMEDADGFLAPGGQYSWELGSLEGPWSPGNLANKCTWLPLGSPVFGHRLSGARHFANGPRDPETTGAQVCGQCTQVTHPRGVGGAPRNTAHCGFPRCNVSVYFRGAKIHPFSRVVQWVVERAHTHTHTHTHSHGVTQSRYGAVPLPSQLSLCPCEVILTPYTQPLATIEFFFPLSLEFCILWMLFKWKHSIFSFLSLASLT